MKRTIIISISSDIGQALCQRYVERGDTVHGTYRHRPEGIPSEVWLYPCDLARKDSVFDLCKALYGTMWDLLVFCPGTQEPVGKFDDVRFGKWAESVEVNFLNQMRILHSLLPYRSKKARVLFFAGGGTNNAPTHYSGYIISKIALVKMVELLDAEIPDVVFGIIGPGWVKTKIHQATFNAGEFAGSNYMRTVEKLEGNDLTPMSKVVECCEWFENAPYDVVGGRNISLVHDKWGSPELDEKLRADKNMYKLRRFKNAVS